MTRSTASSSNVVKDQIENHTPDDVHDELNCWHTKVQVYV